MLRPVLKSNLIFDADYDVLQVPFNDTISAIDYILPMLHIKRTLQIQEVATV